ncbi:MAG: ATP-binding protein [Cyclobacteriaceae bacterium]
MNAIVRTLRPKLLKALTSMPVVTLLGPRQVGKTTLAKAVAQQDINKPVSYFDLELDSDQAKFSDAEAFLRQQESKLTIIDEIQHQPQLFRILRGLVDERKQKGERAGQFLLLGSASRDLLQQTSESLAGRVRFLELSPFTLNEVQSGAQSADFTDQLWLRGGFPDSYLAADDQESWDWRSDFIRTYIERDIPQLGVNIAPSKMRRFWTMLAHLNGQQVNFSNLGKSLDASHTTIRNYLDLLTDLYMVRQLTPWYGNTKKRLVKAPKVFVRDTGLLHRLLNIPDMNSLLGHPVIGSSWEGFVIENIITHLTDDWMHSYYRTSNGTEVDLVLETPLNEVWVLEIKRSLAPKIKASYHHAADDIGAHRKFVIYSGKDQYPISNETEVISLSGFIELLTKTSLNN